MDRPTNTACPELSFTAIDPADSSLLESGLRVFIQNVNIDSSSNNLPIDLELGDFSFTDTSGTYTATFNQDLPDGVYNVLVEDDAGIEV